MRDKKVETQQTYAREIACVIAITLVVQEDYNRTVQVQVAGGLTELITSLRLAAEGHPSVKEAIIAAGKILKTDP